MIDFLQTYGLMFLVGAWPYGPIGGFAGTIILASLSIAGAFPLALLIGICRTRTGVARKLATSWVYFFRSVPLIMILFWAYFVLPVVVDAEIPPFATALCGIIAYESAFLAEIVRAGLEALPAGQVEASRAIGLGYWRTLLYVQLPQALSNMIPSFLNQFVSAIKATSIAFVIGVGEATFAAQQINSIVLTNTFRTYVVLALFYFALCALLSKAAKVLDAHIQKKRAGVVL